MGLNSNLSGVAFSGIGSGIDSATIVAQLMQIERRPLQRLEARKIGFEAQRDVYSQFRSRFQTLNGAATALNASTAFSPVKAASSDSTVATVSASSGANPGIYTLRVSRLAQAQKLGSTAQTSATQALGTSGSFIVNGKAVTVEATDTLTSIASKLNGLGNGVTASVIDAGPGNAFLTLTAQASGADGRIQIANVSGGALGSLGFTTGAAVIRDPIGGTGARTYGFRSATESLQSMTGAAMTGTFQVNGEDVSVDFATDTLQSLATKITATGTGATASVVTSTENGKTVQKIEITGTGMPAGLTDTSGTLEALGVYQRGYQSVLVAAQNAEFTLDGVAVTRSSNTVTDVIPGVTLTLLKADVGTPPTTTLSFTRDTDAIKASVKSFMTAVNGVLDFVRTNSAFDKESFAAGPLFSDPLASQAVSALVSQMLADVPGGALTNLTQVGFGLDETGNVKLDEAALDRALAENPEAVRRLFAAVGSGSTNDLRFVSSTGKTKSPPTGSFTVEVTQLATRASMTGGVAQTDPSTAGETLTFGGSAFGNVNTVLFVPSGSTASSLVSLINNDTRLKDVVEASIDGSGQLVVQARRFGTQGDFTLVSDQAAASNNSGIGTSGGTFVGAVNVAGRINGEDATGNGQFLTGNTGNANTEGLQIQYTGSALGLVGSVNFSRGIASLMSSRAEQFTETGNGLLTAADASLQSQVEALDVRITEFEALLSVREERLKARFLAMERAISRLQQQQAQFAQVSAGQR